MCKYWRRVASLEHSFFRATSAPNTVMYEDFNVLSDEKPDLLEPLGNWIRIGTEGARFATIDVITQTRGVGLLCLTI